MMQLSAKIPEASTNSLLLASHLAVRERILQSFLMMIVVVLVIDCCLSFVTFFSCCSCWYDILSVLSLLSGILDVKVTVSRKCEVSVSALMGIASKNLCYRLNTSKSVTGKPLPGENVCSCSQCDNSRLCLALARI